MQIRASATASAFGESGSRSCDVMDPRSAARTRVARQEGLQVAHRRPGPDRAPLKRMVTRLETPLRREITADGEPFTVTLTPDGLRIVPKGKRNGIELAWTDLVNGEAALAVALNASLARLPVLLDHPVPAKARPRKRTRQ